MKSLYLIFTILFAFPAFATDLACENSYKKIYRDDELNISIFLGYSDSGDMVTDPFDRTNLIETLTGPCYEVSGEQFCGFKRDPDDADAFTKTIVRSNGKQDKVKIKITNSAFTTLHNENIGKYSKHQAQKTEKTNQAFNRSLANDEVVIYNGHARRGTGPGFKPMGTLNWINAVQNKPALTSMVQTLKNAKTKPALIGMITCEGESHYAKVLNETSPNSALLLTRQTTSFDDAYSLLIGSVDAILKKDCAKDFRTSIKNSVRTVYTNKLDGETKLQNHLPEVYGLFEPITKKFSPPRGVALTYLRGEIEEATPRDVIEMNQPKVESPR